MFYILEEDGLYHMDHIISKCDIVCQCCGQCHPCKKVELLLPLAVTTALYQDNLPRTDMLTCFVSSLGQHIEQDLL